MTEYLFTYTRAQAIEDGVLVDVSETAREAGFTIPVAVTDTVWNEYVEPDDQAKKWGQGASGRLWDVVWIARIGAKCNANASDFLFTVRMVMKEKQPSDIQFKAMIHGGDNGEPVITITMPNED